MGAKIITKTDRQMEDRQQAVAGDAERADTLAKARAFKRTWLELAEALASVQHRGSWKRWGFEDFDAYCRNELHLRTSTVAKLLGSYRFLETSAPRVLERARGNEGTVPSLGAVEFVAKATERGAADDETLSTIRRAAFDEGAEAPLLSRKFREVAFPEDERDRGERLRQAILQTARKLAQLVAEAGSPVPKRIAAKVEETVGELLESMEN
ncbi:MAG: hypothetical protein IPI49_24300 [Myxococcales bacterium]|nr:hypothetical protein [Myxococcales bacterium]